MAYVVNATGDAHAHFDTGMELRAKHRWKAAAEAFERARTLRPEWALAWFWEAVSLDNRGEEGRAIPRYESAIELGLPENLRGAAWTWLASSHSKVGDAVRAQRCLELAAKNGGYAPEDEYRRIRDEVERRILRLHKRESQRVSSGSSQDRRSSGV